MPRSGRRAAFTLEKTGEASEKILVVDDFAPFRKLVEHSLSQRNFTLIFASSGKEAIRVFSENTPALVILDWMMPDLGGIEVCRHIRAEPQTLYTYIIFLSAKTEKESVIEALEAGADDYLTKPFNEEELLARIDVGLRTIDLHRQLEAKNALLRELAITDSLTGLPNRRAVNDLGARQLRGARRHGFSFQVVMADLDYFKQVNDKYGHDAGDRVLKKFAQILKDVSKDADLCGRMGGEEFLLILSHASVEEAANVVERVRAQIESTEFIFGGQRVTVTASFGIADLEKQQEADFTRLIARADKALYAAKRLGRNRIELG
jgi:diguanylate cyclase (GGDEF)-like protein